jgi:subtilisin family serine protease
MRSCTASRAWTTTATESSTISNGAQFTGGEGQPTNGDPFDDLFHGTHVAGIIGATGNNGIGIAGVNHAVRLMAVKAFNSQGEGATADALAALEYAVSKGAHLTSNSWGGPDYDQALSAGSRQPALPVNCSSPPPATRRPMMT